MMTHFSSRRLAVGTLWAIIALLLSLGSASATPRFWTDGTQDDNWQDGTNNWYNYYNTNDHSIPQNYDVVYFNTQQNGNFVSLGGANTAPLQSIYFTGNGNGYTLGTGSDGGIIMVGGWAIVEQASVVGSGLGETINAPIELQDYEVIANFSPDTPTSSVLGINGYNNPLTLNGNITKDDSAPIVFYGAGDIHVNGNIIETNGGTLATDMAAGSLYLTGNNSITGGTQIGGGLVLDYTNNNTPKLNESTDLQIGNNGNGGHVVIESNQGAATMVSFPNTDVRYTSSIAVTAASDPTLQTTVNLGNLGFYSNGAVLDLEDGGSSNVAFTTTSPNYSNTSFRQFVTYDQTYWATSSSVHNSVTNTNSVGALTALTTDDGHAFNDYYNGNYTVAPDGATTTETLSGPSYAETVRFADGDTLNLGGNLLSMTAGGFLVAAGATGNTEITNGTIAEDVNYGGESFINYSSGTLTVAANLEEVHSEGGSGYNSISKNGSGLVVFSGDNSEWVGGNAYINQGVLQMGANDASALGFHNNLHMGDATATLDLNGNSVNLASLNSDGNYVPGNQAAAAGLNSKIENNVAGSISRITIAGYNNDDTNVGSNYLYGDVNLGEYFGGINEGAGAIISLDIEQGNDAHQVQFDLGTANPFGDASGGNSTNFSGIQGPSTEFTGSITVGQGASLGLQGYGDIETMGALVLNGDIGIRGNQFTTLGATYLSGTGTFSYQPYNVFGSFDLNHVGSVADTFNGSYGTSSLPTSMYLITGGTGTVIFTNPIYDNGVNTFSTSKLITPGIDTQTNVGIYGESSITITGTSGTPLGGNIALDGGTMYVSPSATGGDVALANTNNQLGFTTGNLVLDKGGNTSLTVTLGNTGQNFNLNGYGGLVIGSAQGIGALGTTDKVIILSNGNLTGGEINGSYVYGSGNIVGPNYYAQDDSANGTKSATFLSYSGTGTATDAGFVAHNYGTAVDNLNNDAGYGSVDKIDTDYTFTGNAFGVEGLEVDNATLTVNGGLTLGYYYNGPGVGDDASAIILNGGTINGFVGLYRTLYVYSSLAGGTIQNLGVNYQLVVADGPGILTIGQMGSNVGEVDVDAGALNVGSAATGNPAGQYILNGGVLETNGQLNRTLHDAFLEQGDLVWNGGGFAAVGGQLQIDLTQNITNAQGLPITSTTAPLVWGSSPYFLGQGSVMQFGATNATNGVLLENNLDLGYQESPNTGITAMYSRVIDVTANSHDAGDPIDYADFAEIDGTISGSNAYEGLAKDGNGTLFLAGFNTYTGATTIANGALVIYNDTNLGTAPTAAYALNTTPGLTGAALTPGAILINGGATLGVASPGNSGGDDVILNANRQILLASGATGATPSILDVEGDSVHGYTELDFGGVMADYINEVGSLQKEGGGTFNYSGTAYNTGADSVTGGTFAVTGTGSVNSVSGINVDNATPTSNAKFNYASTAVGLTKAVTIGTDGGTFAYNSAQAYSGATTMTIGAKQTLSGGVGGAGNLSGLAVTIGNGGTLLPGDVNVPSGTASVGTLTTGGITLLAGGNYNFILTDMLGAAGTGYSTVDASSVDLTGLLAATPFNINIETILAGGLPGGPSNLIQLGDYQKINFVLISTGADEITALTQAQLDADFAIYTVPNNGATGFDPGPGTWEVVENANDSQLILQYTAVPEPSTWAMLAGGLVLLVVVRRARQRSSV